MRFKGYDIDFEENRVTVNEIRDFDPVHTFECGQCFRWSREPDGSYTGVVRGKAANVACTPGRLVLHSVSPEDFRRIWFDYFDLGRDYGEIKKAVAVDGIMRKAVEFGGGIRLLRQEPWEALVSFILSSNNRIPRIRKIIEELSGLYGEELACNGRTFHAFPGAARLAACSDEQIGACRAGYRCGYVKRSAVDVAEGRFDLKRFEELDTAAAREYLLQLHGVGNKVADCMLLYSGIKQDVFPADVWVRRVMEELYFGRPAGFPEIQRFAAETFGPYAGFAQQYLFYYAREQKIGV
jgi:N-glycosylase/DNA lyase